MSEWRSLRASTKGLLDEERRYANEEIARFRMEHQKTIQKLENEQREQIEIQNRALIELEKKHIRAVQAAEARIETKLKEEETHIREKIETIRQEANNKIMAQKRLFEEQLREMYKVIDRRVNEVMAKIEAIEQDERNLAKESYDNALVKYNSMVNDPDVRVFQADTVKSILEPMMVSCEQEYKKGNWSVVTGKALLIEVECQRTRNDAHTDNREWNSRFNAVQERLQDLIAELSTMNDETMVVSTLGLENEGSLKAWDEKTYYSLHESLQLISDTLYSIPAGQFADLTNIEMNIIRIQNGNLIEEAIDNIVLQITAHLMSVKMLAGVYAIESEEWELNEDSEIVEKEHCSIALDNRHEEILKADVFVDTNSIKRGDIRLQLKLSIRGTKSDEILANNLLDIQKELQEAFLGGEYGYLTMIEDYAYQDEEGYPGYGMDFRPEIKTGTYRTNASKRKNRDELNGSLSTINISQRNEQKGELL